MFDPLSARRVLIVGAHPDDPDFFCGGVVVRWADQGTAVRYVVVTSGDKGMPVDSRSDVQAFMQMREAEQEASAEALGAQGVTFLRYTDGEVFDTLNLREQLTAEIRRFRPDLIITHDPLTRQYRQHPDHRAVGFATLAAAFPACRLATFFPEQVSNGLTPHVVGNALLFGSDQPDTFVDITSVFDRKIAALELHESQASAFPGGLHQRLRRRAEEAGRPANLALAEGFCFVDLE